MNNKRAFLLGLLFTGLAAIATVFGTVAGIIHDPHHRPIQGATVTLKSNSSKWSATVTTDANGEYRFITVPAGDYSINVASPGFVPAAQNVTVVSGTEPVVHFQLQIAVANEKVVVSAAPEVIPT